MAGDWLKMRVNLQSHPKVVRIMSALNADKLRTNVQEWSDKFRVVGGLHAVWGVFDQHSVDGRLNGYTLDALDHIIGWEGFSKAMRDVNWLIEDGPETLVLPEFDEHNGQSAKRRSEDTKRKRESRKSPQNVRRMSADDADKTTTESGPEKRREEKREDQEQEANASLSAAGENPPPADLGGPKPEPIPECPHSDIVAAYHEILPELPRVRTWDADRQKFLRGRWREDRERQSVNWWREFFGYVRTCPLLMGQVERRDAPPWSADLEWLVRPSNFRKVIEGRYEARAA
jgi:hypothetical protein